MGWLFNRQPAPAPEISVEFARVLASHIGKGLRANPEPAEGEALRGWTDELEDSLVRARRALMAVAITLERASGDDPVVRERVALSRHARTRSILDSIVSATERAA